MSRDLGAHAASCSTGMGVGVWGRGSREDPAESAGRAWETGVLVLCLEVVMLAVENTGHRENTKTSHTSLLFYVIF